MATDKKDKPKREKLSIYLVKEGFDLDAQIIKTENSDAPILLNLEQGEAKLYVKKEIPRDSPKWSKLFTVLPEVPADAFGRPNSVGAILLYRLERTFLLSFGHGFHLIQDDAVERDFGLRVTLNSVEPGGLRSLDKASYDHNPLNSRTQSSKELDIFDLEMDAESDLLQAVTGTSKEPLFGSHVTGRDALTLMVEIEAGGIAQILHKALEKYSAVLPPEFEWVDNISKVRDRDDVEILDLLLNDELLVSNSSAVWLGEPEIVDWESQAGYSFDMRLRTPVHPVLELEDLRSYLADRHLSMSVDVLKVQPIHINDASFGSVKCWPAYRCLYAEITSEHEEFILRNATWYRVKNAFVDRIDRTLASLENSPIQFPTYEHSSEGEYNSSVAVADPTFHLMDKRNVAIGGPHDKIEFCDLIKDNVAFVHVKYYRSSATLSHLFAQANVAAETFVRDEDFRVRLNPKLPAGVQAADPRLRPVASRFQIVYAIATTKVLPMELPFFSKVTLKNAISTLRALNFDVQIARIDVAPEFLKKAVFKSNKKPG